MSPKAASNNTGPRRFRGGSRGRARKNELLDAALRVLARDGVRRLTHRAVAVEADAPLGLMTYYFGSTHDLVSSAFGHLAQREIARMKANTASLARRPGAVDDAADVIAHYVSDGLVTSRDFVVAGYELSVEAARREDLALLNRIWCGALQERLELVLTDLGSDHPSEHAQLVLAVVAGLEVNHMADAGPSFFEDVAQPLVRELFRALVPNPRVAPS